MLQPLRGKRRVLAHGFLETVGWSPGGRWIAYINSSRRRRVEGLYVARTDGAKRRRVLPGSILTFAWSPDGTGSP